MNKLEDALSIIRRNGFTDLLSSILWKSEGEFLEIHLIDTAGREQYQAIERMLRVLPDVEVKMNNGAKSDLIDTPTEDAGQTAQVSRSPTALIKSLLQHPDAEKLTINKEPLDYSPSGTGLSICMVEVKYATSAAKHYFENLQQAEALIVECLNDVTANKIEVTIWE
jgi:hypothetical protein